MAAEAKENAKVVRIGSVFRAVRVTGNKASNSYAPVKKQDGSVCKSNEDIPWSGGVNIIIRQSTMDLVVTVRSGS